MGKRKQPFGYKMEFGDIVPEPEEAETVRSIYLKYLAGASFKVLAESLQEQGLPYDGDKPWNKNMVARILENQRYTGTDSFPPLITEEQFLAAQERRKRMTPERTQTPAQKELRKLCGGAPPQYVERQALGILNRLVHDPQLITASISDVADSPIFQRQRRELDDLLRSPPVDEEQAKSSALALASFMLTCIGPEEYETCRLQLLFQCRQPMRELDAELLRQSVRKITYGDIRQEQEQVTRRVQAAVSALDGLSAELTEWDDNVAYQMLEKVTVLSREMIRVTLRNGVEIEQTVEQPKRRKFV